MPTSILSMTVSYRMGIGYFPNSSFSNTLLLSKSSMVIFAVARKAAVMLAVIIISTALALIVISVSTISFDAMW
jgi:hypothetical protein